MDLTKLKLLTCSRGELEKIYWKGFSYFEDKILLREPRSSLKLGWDDLVGMEAITDFLKEKLQGERMQENVEHNSALENSFLLVGPPGVGKSLIGKVLAKEIDANYLTITGSDIYGRCLGESETNIRAMFDVARKFSPTIIFIDDCDGLLRTKEYCTTGDAILKEFLHQAEGVDPTKDNKGIYIFLTSSMPWLVDVAIPQKVRNVIPIKLPTTPARKKVLEYCFKKNKAFVHILTDQDFDLLAEKTEGYSSFDLCFLIEEVKYLLGQKAAKATHFFEHKEFPTSGLIQKEPISYFTPVVDCSDNIGARKMSIDMIPAEQLRFPVVTMQFVTSCLKDLSGEVQAGGDSTDSRLEISSEEADAVFRDTNVSIWKKYTLYERLYSTVAVEGNKSSPGSGPSTNNQAPTLKILLGGENQCFDGIEVDGGTGFECQILETFLKQEIKGSSVFRTDGRAGAMNRAVTKAQIYMFYKQSCKKVLQILLQCEKCRNKNSDLSNWLSRAELNSFLVPPEDAATKCLERILSLYSFPFEDRPSRTRSGLITASSDFLYDRKASILQFTCAKLLCAMSECKHCRRLFSKELPHQTPLPKNSADSLKKRICTSLAAFF